MGYNVFGLEQDIIQFSCSLTYTGNTQPTLEWSLPGYDVNKPEPTGSATSSCVTSTLKLPPKKEYNDVKFQCTANIAQAKQQGVDSGLHWESKTVIVKCKLKVLIHSTKDSSLENEHFLFIIVILITNFFFETCNGAKAINRMTLRLHSVCDVVPVNFDRRRIPNFGQRSIILMEISCISYTCT